MPGRPRQVGFAPVPATYSRLPRDDEKLVMRRFARHAADCTDCLISKGDLCSKGYSRAKDVEEYIFQKSGKAYSAIDLEAGKRMQVEIPSDCGVVRDLFKGMERGLRIRAAKKGVESYDRNYYVPSRKPAVVERKPRVPKYEIEEPKRKHSVPTASAKNVYGTERREHVRPRDYHTTTAQPAFYYASPPPPAMQGFTYAPDPYAYYY